MTTPTERDALESSDTPTPQDPETPVDNDVDNAPENEEPFSTRLIEASANLTPSEVVPPDKVGAVLGALLYAHDNDAELPPPLHERFPDKYPEPDNT